MDATEKAQIIEKRSKLQNVHDAQKGTVEYFDYLLTDLSKELTKYKDDSVEYKYLNERFEDLKNKRWQSWSTMECARIELAMEVNQLPLIEVPGHPVVKGVITGPAKQGV